MTLANLPIWPFEPNWTSSVGETLEWLTDVLMSPSGAEQRRSLRYFPRRTLNFTVALDGEERALFDNLLMAYATADWYLPIWQDTTISTATSTFIGIQCEPSAALAVGTPIFVRGATVFDYHVAEITEITSTGIKISPVLPAVVPEGTLIYPMVKARLVEQPPITAMTDAYATAEVQFLVTDKPDDPGTVVRTAGPLIADGLIANAYHQETGRGGYFHHNSGTSEGQFIFIYGLYLAYEQLIGGTAEQATTARYYKALAEQMLDAIAGPLLRQAIPPDAGTLTLMHWLFAARGDIPGQEVVLSYEVSRTGSTLRIPESVGGDRVFKVWQIYPGTSELLYDSPFSPAYDIITPAGETQIVNPTWARDDFDTVVTVPPGSPVHATWKIVFGYETEGLIPIGDGYEAYPNWTEIAAGYAACAPDTFRWFEQAMQKAIEHDERPGKAANWTALQLAMRRTAVKGQNITDLREVFEPMPGFDAIPIKGAPDGMYCYSSIPEAKGPPVGGNTGWKGYGYWSRNSAGMIVGKIPATNVTYAARIYFPASLQYNPFPPTPTPIITINGIPFSVDFYSTISGVLGAYGGARSDSLNNFIADVNDGNPFEAALEGNNVIITSDAPITVSSSDVRIPIDSSSVSLPVTQIGRGFADQWRTAQTYQDADQFLYLRIGVSRALSANEHVRVYVSSTQAYDPATRWFAEIKALAGFAPTSTTQEFFIPRSAFRLATNSLSGNQTTWGTVLPAGTEIQNFGIEVANQAAVTINLHSMRLVSDDTAEAVKGSPMPFFPGALPFAINGDMRRQRLVGWNGSPFHGYQLPDHWWWLNADAIAVHGGKDQNDLPVPAPDGSLTYPITALTAGGVAKPLRALLMEQQLLFLSQAQAKYAADGGPNGFFAHTFVLNTPARASLGNPTPHTWVYANDDPNTRWVGYQTRVVESLAELVLLTTGTPAFADARTLALNMASAWLTRLNVLWPNLNGPTIFGMPTDFPDPAISAPQTLYEEPHAAAHVLRACLTLKKAGAAGTSLYDALILRCWNYLELMWRTTGEMAYTWSPAPGAKQWYGFWHGDIITTLALMLDNPSLMPVGVSLTTVADRLVLTKLWIEEWGVGRIAPNTEAGLVEEYRGFHVLTLEPDWTDSIERGQQRLVDQMAVDIGTPLRVDTANRPFPTQSHAWILDGIDDHARFYALMQALRGRAVPVWMPTWMYDLQLAANTVAGATTITTARCGYTLAGGPRPEREDIMIETVLGERIYRRILDSAVDGSGQETLLLDAPIPVALTPLTVIRICFMSLMRLDQDSVEIEHLTDLEGASEVQVTFRAAPNLRVAEAAFHRAGQ